MGAATEIADWAAASPVIDGVLFAPPGPERDTLPICAVAVARGVRGYGKGLTQSEALVSALGEAVERYGASQAPAERLLCASFRELQDEAFDPRWLCLYSDEQYRRAGFPYQRFDENRALHWAPGWWLDTGEAVYLPAFATYLTAQFAPEALCQMSSNGLAAALSVEDAARRAALELHERDAFYTSWIALRGAVRVDSERSDPGFAQIAEGLKSQGAQLELYLVSSGQPPLVAISVGLGDGSRWPAVTLGLGAAACEREAVNKAILEHGQTGPLFARLWRSREVRIPAIAEDIVTLEDHALYYCDPAHCVEFNRWRNNAGSTSAVNPATDRVRIAAADLTPPDLASSPFRVVRALARGLQPAHFGVGFERTYTPRLQALLAERQPNLAPPPIC